MAGNPEGHVVETWASIIEKICALGSTITSHTIQNEQPFTRIAYMPRGGMFVAGPLAYMLGMSGDEVLSLGITSYSPGSQKSGGFDIGQLPAIGQVEGQRILLVDDVHDTGRTFELARSILEGLGASAVCTAAIHFKPGRNETGIMPDFFVTKTDGWIDYPWEELEQAGKLYRQALETKPGSKLELASSDAT